MDKSGLLLIEIGEAKKAVRQLIRILNAHQEEAPPVQLAGLDVSDSKSAIHELGLILNDYKASMVVMACGSDAACMLPELNSSMKVNQVPRIAITKTKDSTLVRRLFESGFSDCFIPPLREVTVWPRIIRHLPPRNNTSPKANSYSAEIIPGFMGQSPAVKEALGDLLSLAKSNLSVLITGETGTGKEVCARAIHHASLRADKVFNPVNCGAIPLELMENELFGHESGAYTGAKGNSLGIIKQTEGGTLFLDEIDALSLKAQVKLLRFLEAGESRALGSATLVNSNVRVIAATNGDLHRLVEEKRFRADVLYRLKVVHVELPPLREREGDVAFLARYFLRGIGLRERKHPIQLSPEAIQKLVAYDWPGNVRELKHIIERAVIRCCQGVTTIQASQIELPNLGLEIQSYRLQRKAYLDRLERTMLLELLQGTGGNITRAAQQASMDRRQFARKIKKFGVKMSRQGELEAMKHSRSEAT